jgi:glycerol-3-phosphate dehydrogenase
VAPDQGTRCPRAQRGRGASGFSANERALHSLRREIVELGGNASVMRSEILAGAGDLTSTCSAARDDGYGEVIDKCRDLLKKIENETAAAYFTYAELEGNE